MTQDFSLSFNISVTVWHFITAHQLDGNPSLLPSGRTIRFRRPARGTDACFRQLITTSSA